MRGNGRSLIYSPWILVLLTLWVSFAFQGSRGLYETTEGRYAECAREMVASGNYLEPTLAYRPHWSKPPLTYWAIAAGIQLFGKSEWGVRLYGAAAFFLTIWIVMLLGKTLWGEREGLLVGLIYLSSPFPLLSANVVSTDTLLTLWEILAVFFYLRAYVHGSERRLSPWITAMWVSFGLGFFTKGPPALVPLLPILLWNLFHRGKVKLLNPLGLLLFIGTGFSWYLIVAYRHPGLWSYFLGHEVAARFTSGSFHNSEWYKPFFIYLPVLALGTGAWAPMAAGSFRTCARRLFKGVKERGVALFLLMWLGIPLLIFCLAKSRLPLYVLPLYAPVALIIARGWSLHQPDAGLLKKAMKVALIASAALTGVKGLAAYYPSKRDMRRLYRTCRMVGGPGTRVAVFDRRKLYGLQYYLDGRLARISYTGEEPWATGGIEETLKRIRETPGFPAFLFVVDEAQERNFRVLLEKWHIPFLRHAGRYWRFYLLFSDRRRDVHGEERMAKEAVPARPRPSPVVSSRVLTRPRWMW